MNIWSVKQSTVIWIALALGAVLMLDGLRFQIAAWVLGH